MEFNSSSEFNQDFLGKGLFGKVYHYGDKAIKQYHIVLYKYDLKNPCLKLNKKKFKLMKARASKIKNTPLVEDLLYINGEFSGVVYPYIEGENLVTILDELTIEEKQYLSKQIIRNAKELTDNNIYPKDYKLSNILKCRNGNIQILDTDDVNTKVTLFQNSIHLSSSLKSLRRLLVAFLEDEDYFSNTKDKGLHKHDATTEIMGKPVITYESLTEYVDKKTASFNTVFINIEGAETKEDLNVNKIDLITKFANCNVILVSKDFNQTLLQQLLDENIAIYDYLELKESDLDSAIEAYLTKHNIERYSLLDKDELEDEYATVNAIHHLNGKPKVKDFSRCERFSIVKEII